MDQETIKTICEALATLGADAKGAFIAYLLCTYVLNGIAKITVAAIIVSGVYKGAKLITNACANEEANAKCIKEAIMQTENIAVSDIDDRKRENLIRKLRDWKEMVKA